MTEQLSSSDHKEALDEIVNKIDASLPKEISSYLIGFINNKFASDLRYWYTPIEKLKLPAKAYNSLKRANITKMGDLITKSDNELRSIKGFKYGSIGLNQIKQALAKYGLDVKNPSYAVKPSK